MTIVVCITQGLILALIFSLIFGEYGLRKAFSTIKDDLRLTREDYQRRLGVIVISLAQANQQITLLNMEVSVLSSNIHLMRVAVLDLTAPVKTVIPSKQVKGRGRPPGAKSKGKGRKLTAADKKKISDKTKARWASYSIDERNARVAKFRAKRGRPKKKAAQNEQPQGETIELASSAQPAMNHIG